MKKQVVYTVTFLIRSQEVDSLGYAIDEALKTMIEALTILPNKNESITIHLDKRVKK